jgi:hypothetical protein
MPSCCITGGTLSKLGLIVRRGTNITTRRLFAKLVQALSIDILTKDLPPSIVMSDPFA